MSYTSSSPESGPLDGFAVEVFSELGEETVIRRAREVNILLRMSMLIGLEMELVSTLNLICDMAGEIVSFARAMIYFWEEDSALMHARVTRNMPTPDAGGFTHANMLNYWAAKLARPLLLTRHCPLESVGALLQATDAGSVLVVPLFVRNQVLGSMQLFGERPDSFSREDAQLLWMLSLIAESMLARDYSNETLLRFAFTDFLTGLKTRGFFEQQLVLELARAERRETSLAVLMIDIDHFKRLNDVHGHPVGDLVLRDFAAILTHDLREIDTAARYGGEEFILLLPETDLQGAKLVAQRLRTSVDQTRFSLGSSAAAGQRAEHVTISIGIALFPEDARSRAELLEASDAALYQAKGSGRNRVVTFAEIKGRKAS